MKQKRFRDFLSACLIPSVVLLSYMMLPDTTRHSDCWRELKIPSPQSQQIDDYGEPIIKKAGPTTDSIYDFQVCKLYMHPSRHNMCYQKSNSNYNFLWIFINLSNWVIIFGLLSKYFLLIVLEERPYKALTENPLTKGEVHKRGMPTPYCCCYFGFHPE